MTRPIQPPPWRMFVVFSDSGNIRKWSREPFEVNGARADEFQLARVAGVHTCSDACDRPLCVARREIAALKAAQEARND